MSLALAGALAAGAAVAAALLAAIAPRWRLSPARHPDALALADAGVRIPLHRWEGLRASLVSAGVAAVAVLGAPPILPLACAVAPSVWVRLRAERARDRAGAAVLGVVVTIESTLRSEGSLAGAIARAVEACPDPLARRPFEAALREFHLGAPLDASLSASARLTADRRGRLALETFALGVAERLPRDRLATLASAVADRLAFEERLEGEVRSRTAGLRGQVVLLALLVPGIGLYLALTMPSLAAVYASETGRTLLLPAAGILEVAGLILSRGALRAGTA